MDMGRSDTARACRPPVDSLLLPSRSSDTRWRRAQRRRLGRRLTLRGRATLLGLAALAGGGALWGTGLGGSGAPALPTSPPERTVRTVSVSQRPDSAPPELLERLPVGRESLALGSTDALAPPPGDDGYLPGLLFEMLPPHEAASPVPLRVEYTLDAELNERVWRILRRARVELGHVIVLDPATGRLLAYASTDPERFPPTRAYPAASLVKIVTAAAALDRDPGKARLPCRYRGSPYRLTPGRIDPPRQGHEASLRRALATSNNQCFAQLAVHAVGAPALLRTLDRFGWLRPPAPAHSAGAVDAGEDRYDLGRLGCGLGGSWITPLHAAQLAGSLARGEVVAPRWIQRVVDAEGRELRLPAPPAARAVVTPTLAGELRSMLVETTTSGTARRAFRRPGGRPRLGALRVAGKTGSLSGEDPPGRYEWFAGAAPADRPRLAVAVLMVQGDLYWRTASQVAAEVFETLFCEKSSCRSAHAERWLARAPVRLAGAEALSSASVRR